MESHLLGSLVEQHESLSFALLLLSLQSFLDEGLTLRELMRGNTHMLHALEGLYAL